MKGQMSFFDFSDEFQKMESHYQLKKLSDYIDFAEIVPRHVRDRYYKQTGRPPYSIESMLSALVIQKIYSIPTNELLVKFLELSRPVREFCGFNDSVPDEATFTRFKQKLSEEDFKEILHQLVKLTEPYLQEIDPFDSSLLVLDTTGLEVPVKENNPKYFYSLKRQVEKGAPNKPEHEITAMTLANMPKAAKAEPKAKLSYTNGHFAYAYTSAVLTNGFGIVRDIDLFEGQKDSTTLKPIMESFKSYHGLNNYKYFSADAGFDSNENYRYLIEDCSLYPVISLNPRNSKNLDENYNVNGIPVCSRDNKLTFKFDGYCDKRKRLKWVCPLNTRKGNYRFTTCQNPCTDSSYGRVIYTYPEDNYRMNTPIPRGSHRWKKIYKKRVVSEHAISRLKALLNMGRLNVRDYHSVFAEFALAAIAQNVVALIACRSKYNDKIRSVRWLAA